MKEALKKSFEILLKNGEYAEAEKLLILYMKENPEDWDAKLLYGTCRMMQGDSETAKLIHQQAQMYFESGKEIPEEQRSFWDKYKKLIFYGAIGTALVLGGYVAYMKCMPSSSLVLKYGGPQYNEYSLYAGPEYYRKKQNTEVLEHYNVKYAGPSRDEYIQRLEQLREQKTKDNVKDNGEAW